MGYDVPRHGPEPRRLHLEMGGLGLPEAMLSSCSEKGTTVPALKRTVEGVLKTMVPELVKRIPALATHLIRQWNAMVLRDEYDKARAAISVEFAKNRAVARIIYEKYNKDMSPAVEAIYRDVMEGSK